MPVPHRINPRPPSTPAALRTTRGGRRAIPDDLLREASRRVGVMGLLGAVLWVVASVLGHVVYHLLHPADPGWYAYQTPDVVATVAALVSFAGFLYTRYGKREPEFMLDMGLGFVIFTGLALGVVAHWRPLTEHRSVSPEMGWSGALVLMFAAIVPTTPRKMFVTGLIAVSMPPLAMLIAKLRGSWDFGPAYSVLLMHYPDYLLVGVAVVISHVVTKLGQQVTRARELGSYELGELLGRGGMGEVYTAHHRMLARPAAIKLIRPETLRAADGESAQIAVKRFYREAEVAASLRSPHTVELYDFGVTEDETLYFVMELLDGMDLESLVRRFGPLPASRAVHVLRQVCESLEEAHARGLVHRDIKPANIHVGRLGLRHDFVKVLDFGLVKPVSRERANADYSLATGAGLTPGTPAYMAPEVSLGDPVDGRADLYAVGCVAHFLLTGRLVFEAENAVRLVVMHLQDEPDPPSRLAPFPVPPALDELVLSCLAKAPDGRPRSAAEVSQALSAVDVEPWGEAEAAAWWRANHPASALAVSATPSPVSAAPV
ncbi:MAG TPA: serine/threonine-protein kinase [Gemmatimonadaceae bacterium]|nr:serine/threonine-protein kinase [Gemmatimonadaceae bacterium]